MSLTEAVQEQEVLLERDIYTVEQYLQACEDLKTSMGLYNLLLVLYSWRKCVEKA